MWRWDKPSEKFTQTKNDYFNSRGIRFKSHNNVVCAGLNPIDWEFLRGEKDVLHKIVLTKEQAELCVVAEADFRPTEEEFNEFVESRHISIVGSKIKYNCANYENSFVSPLEYSGNYNLPEVLIPFPVKADVASYPKLLILFWKLKMWCARVLFSSKKRKSA